MSRALAAALLALLGACKLYARDGDDTTDSRVDTPIITEPFDAWPDANSNGGFVMPTAPTKANVNMGGVWTEVGDADWTCLGTSSSDQPSTGTIALSGRVRDFQTGNGVGGAAIRAWTSVTSGSLGDGTSSSAAATRGDYAMTLAMLPAGVRRYHFYLTASSYLPTRVLGRYYAPGNPAIDDIHMISEATATAIPAFIGFERDQTKALVWGTMRDCAGRFVSNAVVGISLSPATFANAGGETFYFSAGSTSLPVRRTVEPVMNNDGMFTVLDAPVGAGFYIQVWGFRTIGELNAGTLTLLGVLPGDANPGEGILADVEPRRI